MEHKYGQRKVLIIECQGTSKKEVMDLKNQNFATTIVQDALFCNIVTGYLNHQLVHQVM